MAYNFVSVLAFLFILNILAGSALAGRDIGIKDSKMFFKKMHKPIIGHDGTVLVPGLGRYYVFPRPGTLFNPYTYNPVTGNSGGGSGFPMPGAGTIGSRSSGSYIPGGDDTLVPNPGVEVPNPSGGGGSSSSSNSPPASP